MKVLPPYKEYNFFIHSNEFVQQESGGVQAVLEPVHCHVCIRNSFGAYDKYWIIQDENLNYDISFAGTTNGGRQRVIQNCDITNVEKYILDNVQQIIDEWYNFFGEINFLGTRPLQIGKIKKDNSCVCDNICFAYDYPLVSGYQIIRDIGEYYEIEINPVLQLNIDKQYWLYKDSNIYDEDATQYFVFIIDNISYIELINSSMLFD